MSAFIERYRYAVGSILLVLILTGGAFLLWRENKWKPGLEKRLDALQLEIEQVKISGISTVDAAQSSQTSPTELITQITEPASQQNAGKVAGANTSSNKTSSKPATSNKPATTTPAPSSVPATSQTAPSTPSGGKPPLPVALININTASAYELTALPGIGTVTAQNIIDYRNSHGSFNSISELDNVKNIGEATINKIRDHITVN